MSRRPLLALLGALLFAIACGAAAGATSYDDRVVGEEVPPISSTRGTFVGAARGELSGAWRITIRHEELRTGPTVAITGGSFSMRTALGRRIVSQVAGGSVSVVRSGKSCTNQVYAVDVRLAPGAFTGTLTHRRRSVLGHCVIYAATIAGRATIVTQ
jgi:hypothetical protein